MSWEGTPMDRPGTKPDPMTRELRQRRLSEDRIADVLREIQGHLQETGQSPEEAFGKPRDYAAGFPKGTTLSVGSWIGNLAAVVLLALLGVKVFTGQVLGISLGLLETFLYLGGTLALSFALIIWSQLLQEKLPEGLSGGNLE